MDAIDISDVMDTLYRHRAANLPASALADVFDRLIWCLDDNGDALLRVREDWLRGDDRGRVEIALAMEETFPFNDAAQMDLVFKRIVEKWPEFSARCEEVRRRRAAH